VVAKIMVDSLKGRSHDVGEIHEPLAPPYALLTRFSSLERGDHEVGRIALGA
jgi:hypothetical protein